MDGLVERFLLNQYETPMFEWIMMENRKFLTELLHTLSDEKEDPELLSRLGKEIYRRDIGFTQFAIFLDLFVQEAPASEKLRIYHRRDLLAREYLKERMPGELAVLKRGIHNNPAIVAKPDLKIVQELLDWMEHLLDTFLHGSPAPEIRLRIDDFIQFVEMRTGLFFDDPEVKRDFLATNRKLYRCAEEAVGFAGRGEYYHFVLVYTELLALFLKMVTLLGSMFLEEELLSVYVDPITLLPNRFQLLRDFSLYKGLYILVLNLHDFSKLNLLYGYEMGDGLLKKIAAYLQSSDTVKNYRIYGDEFALIFRSEASLRTFFERINHALQIESEGQTYDLMFYGAYDVLEERSLESCEFALVRGEHRGLIDSREVKSMMVHVKRELTMTQKLKEVMLNDAIVPYYQPIRSTRKNGNSTIRYEVLMRVRYGEELLEPEKFLNILVEAPFYVEFTKSMLFKSFETFRDRSETFSVNFTLKDIKDRGLRLFLESLVKQDPETAKRMTIEIVETEALKEFESLNAFIRTFRRHGITFALDDFGSGYSNFAQCAKLDIDFIKIDGTIVQKLPEDEKMRKLLDSILHFAKTFGLKTIAEYVSSKEIYDYVASKVDMVQGFYVGEPAPLLQE